MRCENCKAYEYQAEQLADSICSKMPLFSDYHVSITEYGAIEASELEAGCLKESSVLYANTKAVRDAVREVSTHPGGGMVVVPAGIYDVGAIHLESNVELHLEKHAVLRFAREPKWYEGEFLEALYGVRHVHTRFEGVELMNYSPLIYAWNKENIAITGAGVLDGHATEENWHWWKNCKKPRPQDAPRMKLFIQGEQHVPVEKRIYGEASGKPGECDDGYLRPSFLQTYGCQNILMEGVTIVRSPMWEIHPVLCENVIVRNVCIDTHLSNNDGIDPECCRNVLIEGCHVDVGDDCIAIKSGRNEDARRIGQTTRDVVIRNNTFADGHGGVTIGSEISCGVSNVYIYNNVMDSPNLWTALRLKSNNIRGGVVEDIYYWNNEIRCIQKGKRPVLIEMSYETVLEHAVFDEREIAYIERTPRFCGIHIVGLSNADATIIGGLPEIMWE